MSYVDEVIARVVKENPNEPEFHQAVKEVLTPCVPWWTPTRRSSAGKRCWSGSPIPNAR